MVDSPVTFSSPTTLLLAGLLVAVLLAVAWIRHVCLPRPAAVLLIVGCVLTGLAAGGLNWRRPIVGEVAVMVDCSASTRTASYRDRGKLQRRLQSLLGSVPYKIYLFAGDQPIADDGRTVNDLPGDRTVLSPPLSAGAVVLFSDGQFAASAALPRTFAVIDEGLQAARDAQVADLRIAGVETTVRLVGGSGRSLRLDGTDGLRQEQLAADGLLVRRRLGSGGQRVTAALSTGDPWPENDVLTADAPPIDAQERWFVSTGRAAPAGYVNIAPADLPGDASSYLRASVIVLDNVAASALTPLSRDRLLQYVRDLGGGLVILGGSNAFAAGGYANTPLETLSPLASVPPTPSAHWYLLTDGSGSMNTPAGTGQGSRWQEAVNALLRALPVLPPADRVDVGSFAADVAWWSVGRSAAETQTLPLPPPGVLPTGVTNLVPAVQAVALKHDGALPGRLLLLTDTDAEVPDPVLIIDQLRSRKMSLFLLATGEGRGLVALTRVANETGGAVLRQDTVSGWADATAKLMTGAVDRRIEATPADVRFSGPLASLPGRAVSPWNQTFIKPRAIELASAARIANAYPMVGEWSVGEGKVVAAAFAATNDELAALASRAERSPRDPRLSIEISTGARLAMRIDAISPPPASELLNGLKLTAEYTPDEFRTAVTRFDITQTAPGRYELSMLQPRDGGLLTLRMDGVALQRLSLPKRYSPEFDAIGINREVLSGVTQASGGRVIELNETGPIDFRWPTRELSLTPWLATAGALCWLAGLIVWKRA